MTLSILKKNILFNSNRSLTSSLIWTNIIVFIAVKITDSDNESSYLLIGANCKDLTFNSQQYWRLISSLFIHYNFLHLIVNMFALWGIGLSLEKRINKLKYVVIYLLTGILAGLSVLFHPKITLGSSGAIMGLTGLLVFEKLHSSTLSKQMILHNGIPLLVGFIVELYLSDIIDVVAHLIGLLSGSLIGLLTYRNKILDVM